MIRSQNISEGRRKERILLVDDSRVVRKVFAMILTPKFECVEAGSFDEAILELKRNIYSNY